MIETAKEKLKTVFGFDSFRPQQEEIVEHVLAKKDSIVLMPTGGGKSLCFQVPAIIFEGTMLVISPLISLMKDQVEALNSHGVSAAFFNSSQDDYQKQVIINQSKEGVYKLLYMAPETLFSSLDSWLSGVDVSAIAIDEAHCVSMWGHDFRPEYTRLSQLRSYWDNIPYIALTATADKATRNEILSKLGLKEPKTFLASFDRPNITLEVRGNKPKNKKQTEVLAFIRSKPNESGIIYCLSRKETEEWSTFLSDEGVKCTHYHAGLSSQERSQVQEDFITDEVPIVVATIAFGMGIDKSNVRWVIHNNLPKNIEGYYQEIGRAGRDGLVAKALLYYNMRDVKLLADFAKDSEQRNVLIEKLNRMLQYAESPTCRRKTLLSYFSETMEENCGNCDVCNNPPDFVDGTLIAQKALSGVKRAKEQIGIRLLIQLLRGSQSFDIFDRGLQHLKTYGVGKDLSNEEWQHYITQLLNLGLLEIAYDQNFNLKVTPFGERVLFGKQKIKISRYVKQDKVQQRKQSRKTTTKSVSQSTDELLFEELRSLRMSIAKRKNVPPYIVFSDATLWDMVHSKPLNTSDLLQVNGVGNQKMIDYGDAFIDAIKLFLANTSKGKKNTYQVTKQFYHAGMSPQEIAEERNLNVVTVFSHLAKLYSDGEAIDLEQFITKEELNMILKAVKETGDTERLKTIYDYHEEAINYDIIRIGLTILKKQGKLAVVEGN